MLVFTHLARLFAFLGIVGGGLRVLTGLTIAGEWLGPYRETLTRYAPGSIFEALPAKIFLGQPDNIPIIKIRK